MHSPADTPSKCSGHSLREVSRPKQDGDQLTEGCSCARAAGLKSIRPSREVRPWFRLKCIQVTKVYKTFTLYAGMRRRREKRGSSNRARAGANAHVPGAIDCSAQQSFTLVTLISSYAPYAGCISTSSMSRSTIAPPKFL